MKKAKAVVCAYGTGFLVFGGLLVVLSAPEVWDLVKPHLGNLLDVFVFSFGITFAVLGVVWVVMAVSFKDKN